MPRGGARPNSGPKPGTKHAETLSKEQAREALRQVVMQHMEAMTAAQIAHAQGLKYLVARHKSTGKFEKLTKDQAEKLLSGEESEHVALEVWEKDPSVQAFTDLMNRALDKPKEQLQELQVSGDADLIAALKLGRARVAEAKK